MAPTRGPRAPFTPPRTDSMRCKSVAGFVGMGGAAVSLGDELIIPTGACRQVKGLADKTLAGYTLEGLIAHPAHAQTTPHIGVGHVR